jgi:hypothetical protein
VPGHASQCVMPFDSIPGHHRINELQTLPSSILFHFVPSQQIRGAAVLQLKAEEFLIPRPPRS